MFKVGDRVKGVQFDSIYNKKYINKLAIVLRITGANSVEVRFDNELHTHRFYSHKFIKINRKIYPLP